MPTYPRDAIARYTRSPRSYERTNRAPAEVATARAWPSRPQPAPRDSRAMRMRRSSSPMTSP